jgi:hypothetical protein
VQQWRKSNPGYWKKKSINSQGGVRRLNHNSASACRSLVTYAMARPDRYKMSAWHETLCLLGSSR